MRCSSVSEELNSYARKIALTLLLEGLRAVEPRRLVRESLKLGAGKLQAEGEGVDVSEGVYLVAIGKAAGRMAEAAEEVLGNLVRGGVVAVPRGSRLPSLRRARAVEASHPYPDEGSVEAGRLALEAAEAARSASCPLLVLLSGGGSALAEVPVQGVSLGELREVTELLLRCGAPIDEVNAVRKHLSLLKGGQLAAAAYPSPVLTLALSDVVGDRLDVIASGPTVPDPSTYEEALQVLQQYGLKGKVSKSVVEHLERGLRGEVPETPKPGDNRLSTARARVIGSNVVALQAMAEYARQLGLNALVLTSRVRGEAREAAKALSAIALEVKQSSLPVAPPVALLCGGETTVTVRGKGRGGRCQEFALSAALQIEGEVGIAVAAVGSDGVDGPTDVAGAVVDGETAERARRARLDPLKFLEDNDSYKFFKAVGGHVRTGYTGTNVNDFYIAVVVEEIELYD